MYFLDMVAAVQVEVARPGEKTGGFFLLMKESKISPSGRAGVTAPSWSN
ncbi:hypothetical protein [Streptomyces sp. SD18]